MSSEKAELNAHENIKLGDLGPRLVRTGTALGIAGLGGSLVWGLLLGDGMKRFMHSYLLGFTYVLSFALGALFFVLLQHLVKARWSPTVRRVAEAMTSTFPLLFVLSLAIAIPVLSGYGDLFRWNASEEHVAEQMAPDYLASLEAAKAETPAAAAPSPEKAEQIEHQKRMLETHKHAMHAKHGYLNAPFFLVRLLIYFAVWIFLARFFFRKSVAQDESGDIGLTNSMRKLSAPGMILFAFTTSFASYDLIMSLEPAWFSTIFGVYYFAGCAISIMALLALFHYGLRRNGRLKHSVTVEHYHDLGKLMFAFVFFWGYIAFSQFMLIWYANIPEETFFYEFRWHTDWRMVTLLLLAVHLVLPFPLLMSRHSKRILPVLMVFSVWMLAAHWLDLYWLILPNFDWFDHSLVFHPIDILASLGFVGLFIAKTAGALKKVNLLPTKDPLLGPSLKFENI